MTIMTPLSMSREESVSGSEAGSSSSEGGSSRGDFSEGGSSAREEGVVVTSNKVVNRAGHSRHVVLGKEVERVSNIYLEDIDSDEPIADPSGDPSACGDFDFIVNPHDDVAEKPFNEVRTVIEIGHKTPIFALAVNMYTGPGEHPVFATAGRNMISIYECIQPNPAEKPNFRLVRALVDDNKNEFIYTLTWTYDIFDHIHCIVSAGHNGNIRVSDPRNGKLCNNLWGHGDPVNELRTDPNNSMIIASVSKDNSVRIWNIKVQTCLVILGGVEGHVDQVLSCDWSPDSYFIVSAGMDHCIRMWYLSDEARNLITQSMTKEGAEEINQRKSDNGREHCELIHFPNATTADLHHNYVDCVRFYKWFVISKGSEQMAKLFRFGHINEASDQLFPVKSDTVSTLITTMNLDGCDVWFLKFDIDPVERWIVFGGKDGFIYFFDMYAENFPEETDPSYVMRLENESSVRQIAFAANGRLLIAVTDDFTVTMFERNIKTDKFELPRKKRSVGKAAKVEPIVVNAVENDAVELG